MGALSPKELLEEAILRGKQKADYSIMTMATLGIMAGVFIGLAGVAMIRTMGSMPVEWGTLVNLLGAMVFPVGLICLLLVGGELVTGNMLSVSLALFAKEISGKSWLRNMAVVTLFNLMGALFVAYFFGYLSGTLQGAFIDRTIAVARGRIDVAPVQLFFSSVACNILVCTGVYMNYAAKDFIGKIFGTFLPIMAFVIAGYQHVVANMFLIPAGIFAGGATWTEFMLNISIVWIGNLVGSGFFMGGLYFMAYRIGMRESR